MTKLLYPSENQADPQISIVIPMYNSEKYIETCIDSILLQTFSDFELILIDDCSTDSTLEIVQHFKDPRIKIYRQIKNSDRSDGRNLGIRVAQGKYIFFMDHDDAIMPEMLETFHNASEESDADVIYMNAYLRAMNPEFTIHGKIDVERRIFYNPTPRFLSEILIDRLQKEYLEVGVHVVPWIKIQRRDFLLKNQIYFPNIHLNEDVLFNFAELCFGRRIQVIDSQGYIYRAHSDSIMGNKSLEKNLQAAIISIPSALEFVKEILDSPNLISPIDESFKMKIETEVITRFFKIYVLNAYDGGISVKQIEVALNELLSKPEIFSPLLFKTLINTLATEMLENEKLRGESS